MIKGILAQTTIDIPLDATTKSLVGLLGVLTIALMVLMFWYYARKLFGKHPPLHEELQAVRKEFHDGDEKLDQKIEDLRLEARRSESSMHKKLNGIARNTYLIAGKLGVKTIPTADEE